MVEQCCTDNEFGLNQLDYLVFTQEDSDIFSSLEQSSNDHREVRSNIRNSFDNDTVLGTLYEITTNSSNSHVCWDEILKSSIL